MQKPLGKYYSFIHKHQIWGQSKCPLAGKQINGGTTAVLGSFGIGGTVLYLDCGGASTTTCMHQSSQKCIL